MLSSRQVVVSLFAAAAIVVVSETEARAQWYVAGYLGATHTRPATVSIDRPADDVSLEFRDVEFEGRSWKSPQYYGVRVGRWFGERRRIAIEIEWMHAKAYGRTDRQYEIEGDAGPYADLIRPPATMNALVSRYAMSHGLNYLVANVAFRNPVGQGPFTAVVRAGAGPALPHAESTFAGEAREQYQFAGFGVHAAAGTEIRVYKGMSAVVEYKFTLGRPKIEIVGGTGQMTAVTHHLALGLAFGLNR